MTPSLRTMTTAALMLLACSAVAAQPARDITSRPSGPRPKFKKDSHPPVTLPPTRSELPPPGYKLVFEEQFDGDKLDHEKWGYRVDSKRFSTQRPENVSVRDGKLWIELKKEEFKGKPFTGGGVISRQDFVYAYYESRFKVPRAEGWHTAFWTMHYHHPESKAVQRPYVMEIDICEQDGGDPHLFSFGIVNQYPDVSRGQDMWNAGRWVVEDAPDMAADYHTWGCEITPEVVRFYFDGKLAREHSAKHFDHDPNNIWLTSIAYVGKGDRFMDVEALPAYAVFDYVRVYQHPDYAAAEARVREQVKKLAGLPQERKQGPATNRTGTD